MPSSSEGPKRGRPRTRSPNAKPLQVWLEPEELEVLARYVAYRGLASNAEGVRRMIEGARAFLERAERGPARASGTAVPEPVPEHEEDCPQLRAAREVRRGEAPSDPSISYGVPPSVRRKEEERLRAWREQQERAEAAEAEATADWTAEDWERENEEAWEGRR